MNEQIQNILNENGTKTEKIKKLLALGLTRRAVADLVTNGNYGFVQNVYTRMLRDMNTTIAQVATTTIKEALGTPATPLLVNIKTNNIVNCSPRDISIPYT